MDLLDRLAALGVPADAAGPDGVLDTTVTVYNVDQLRDLLDPGFDEAGRRDHFDALFAGVGPQGGERDAESRLVDRVAAHVFGAEELSDDDREAITPAFPLSVKVLGSPGPMTVSAPKDISTADGRLSIVDVTDLTITQGGYFICRSTPLQFKCQTLTRTGDTGSSAGDFNILGTVGATPPTPPQPPTPTQAPKGKDGECSSSGIAGTGGQPGTAGEPGTPGTPGGPGNPGSASQQATIIISEKLTADRITIVTQSGPGGKGGDGGLGGQGQQGGNGGNGATCECTGNGGGPGNNGGKGGKGGKAGDGGSGVDAAGNIVVKVPQSGDVQKIITIPQPAPPGGPGTPGKGGPGGDGGTGGTAGKNNSAGGGGGNPGSGGDGDPGDYGKVTGKPATFDIRPL